MVWEDGELTFFHGTLKHTICRAITPERQLRDDGRASEQQMRERNQIEKAGNHSALGSAGTLESEVLVSTTVDVPLHRSRAGRSSSQALWPTSKIAAAHSLPHCPEPVLALNEGSKQNQQGITTPSLPA